MLLLTIRDDHHEAPHEYYFPGGIIPSGWYESNRIGGHYHGLYVEKDLRPGERVRIVTERAYGIDPDDHHAHEIEVEAVEISADDELEEMEIEPMTAEELSARRESVEYKRAYLGGIAETKIEERSGGVRVGIVRGYLSTWDADTGGIYGVPDQFVRGAWLQSLAQHRERGNRMVRLKDHHGRTVGGFPIDKVREDEKGLWGEGEVNLEVQAGRELYALAMQRALSDFSVGYVAIDDNIERGVRRIRRAMLLEASIVDEPANPNAQILEVKAVVPFQDLPLADLDRRWDKSAALGRVRRFTESTDAPSRAYRRAFLWFDRENADDFEAYKLPIADVVNGEMVAVPSAIFSAAGSLKGSRGGVDIPSADRPRVVRHLERYYRKLDKESPFRARERRLFIDVETARDATPEELVERLMATGVISRGAAKMIESRLGKPRLELEETKRAELLELLVQTIRSTTAALRA